MKQCDECGKEADKLTFQEVRLPENPNEIIDKIKNPIKVYEMWVCAECKVKYDNTYKEMAKFIRDSQKQLHRKWYESEGDIEDLK